MRVLVTGGAGFIGSHLVRALLDAGHDVRVLDNFSTGTRQNLAPVLDAIELVEGDLRSYERVHTAVRGVELVSHQAALPSVPRSVQDPLTTNAVNVEGTLNVLLAARDERVRRVVFASSSSVYGNAPGFPRREAQPTEPVAPYAVAKLAAESYCRSFWTTYGLETVCLRYFNVFGPRQDPESQYAAVIPRFITRMQRGASPVVYGDGTQSRDFTHVSNVVSANLLAATAETAVGRVLNVASGESHSILRLVGLLGGLLGVEPAPVFMDPRPGEVRRSRADITKAREVLGYAPALGFADALDDVCRWYAARGDADPAERAGLAGAG